MKKKMYLLSFLLVIVLLMSLVTPAFAVTDIVITKQPQNLTFPEGSVALWSVEAAAGNSHITYHWYIVYQGTTYDTWKASEENQPWLQYAGEEAGSNEKGDSFHISGIGSGLNGAEIYCEMEDGHNAVTSNRAMISVGGSAMPPTITVPASMEVPVGTNLDLYCAAETSDGSATSYLWYETASGMLWDIMAINRGAETSHTLHCDTSEAGTRYYVCMVTTSKGGSGYSSPIAVTVTEQATVPQPTITTKKLPDAVVGQAYSAKIECDDSKATFEVYYNPGKANTFENTGLTLAADGTLTGTPKKPGSYNFTICASGEGGEGYATFMLTVTENTTVNITQQPKDTTTASGEGTEASGTPEPDADKAESGTDKQENSSLRWWMIAVPAMFIAGGAAAIVLVPKKRKVR